MDTLVRSSRETSFSLDPASAKRYANDLTRAYVDATTSAPIAYAFICECSAHDCWQSVWLTVGEFEGARTFGSGPTMQAHTTRAG